MSIQFSDEWWASYDDEDAGEYASGKTGTSAYDMTILTDSETTALPHPKNYGDVMFPYVRPKRDEIRSNQDDIYGGSIEETGKEMISSSRDEYIQSSLWVDKLIAQIGDFGGLPASWVYHWQDHEHDSGTPANDGFRYESYGCYLKSFGLTCPENTGDEGSIPYITLEEGCYGTKQDDADGADVTSLTKVDWLAISGNPISMNEDVSCHIGGNAVNSLNFDLKINFQMSEKKENGDDKCKYPIVNKFQKGDVTFNVTFRNFTQYNTFIENLIADSESNYTIEIDTGIANTIIKLTNMRVQDGNPSKIPENEEGVFDLTFEHTSSTIISKEAAYA